MRPVRVTLTAVGASAPIILDHYRAPFSIGINVFLSGTGTPTGTYSVQYTYDEVFNATPSQWIDLPSLANPQSASKDGSLSTPVTAVRLNVTALSAGGTLTMTVIQAGMPGS